MKRDDQTFAAMIPVGLCLGVAIGAVTGFFLGDPARGLSAGAGAGLAFGAALFGLATIGKNDAANDD